MHHHHQQENCSSRSLIIQQSPPSIESTWTEHDHWLFLNALVNTPEDIIAGRWEKIAEAIPGKTAEEVKAYYDGLEHEINEIEAGRVELPVYLDDYALLQVSAEFKKGDGSSSVVSSDSCELLGASPHQISFGEAGIIMGGSSNNNNNNSPTTTSVEKGTKKKKKGNPWSVDEHRRFLEGLRIYGKGDWRMISRNVVCTRTPSQVASHAQKYFIRQEQQSAAATAGKKQKKRSSIHDITTSSDTAMVVNAQSTSSTPPSTPPATNIVYGTGQLARGVDVHYSPLPPPQPISFYGGGEGTLHDQSSLITPPSQPEINKFYGGGEGSCSSGIVTELMPLITPMPISFCPGEGALLPPANNNLYGEAGQAVMSSSPFVTDFYGGATPPPPPVLVGDDDDFLQNLLYQPFF